MKITMPAKQLRDAVEKSSLGALTKKAQDRDRKIIMPTDACIKISASNDAVTFESSSQDASVLLELKDYSAVAVKENGAFCVDAKDYLKLLKTIPEDCTVNISYETNYTYGKDPLEHALPRPNGMITTVAIDSNSQKRIGRNDAYPVDDFKEVDYCTHNLKLFTIKAESLRKCISRVLFASAKPDELWDGIAIYISDGKIVFACTDGKRCAMITADEDVKATVNQTILVNGKLMKDACRAFDDDAIINIYKCEDPKHIFLCAYNTKIILATASANEAQGFPKCLSLHKHDYPISVVIDKADLLDAVNFVSQYNSEKSVFYIIKGMSEIKIEAAYSGDDPDKAIVRCAPITASLKKPVAMSNQFLIDACKKISGDVRFSFTKDEKKIRMDSSDDPRFVHFMQAMEI